MRRAQSPPSNPVRQPMDSPPTWAALAIWPKPIIDMVVASVLMSMGMMMMSPATISLPFKLMLFVLVDGWQLQERELLVGQADALATPADATT